MSIVCQSCCGWVLDHSKSIYAIYSGVECERIVEANETSVVKANFFCHQNMFEIATPFMFQCEASNINSSIISIRCKKKRKLCDSMPSSNAIEISRVKLALENLLKLAKEKYYFMEIPNKEDYLKNNLEARNLSSLYFNEICKMKLETCSGGNSSNLPILVNINGEDHLIPPNSKFFSCDVQSLQLPDDCKFDFVLLDPPWWNKYVRRRKKQNSGGYKMMYNDKVSRIPLGSWLQDGGLVAVWCTNCSQHTQDVVNKWFPKWGLNHIATWFWVKVTKSGETVCQFSAPPGKQPYERILFGAPPGRQGESPPDQRCIVSVPSAVHSHKPPLTEVMKLYLPSQPQCLELFARYMLPGWTSVGDQVLTLQNKKMFKEIQTDKT